MKNIKIAICSVAASICIPFFLGISLSQATLVVADNPDQYPLIGTGSGNGSEQHGLDTYANVNWLADEYYDRDVDIFSIGKYEELYIGDTPQGDLVAVDFNDPWDQEWFTWDGNILDATSGIGHINIPSESSFTWTGHFWYSIKAGHSFGLYDGGLITLTAGVSYDVSIPWDIINDTSGFIDPDSRDNGLSHFSLWAETTPVPEPTTVLLFGTALVGFAGLRLKKKK